MFYLSVTNCKSTLCKIAENLWSTQTQRREVNESQARIYAYKVAVHKHLIFEMICEATKSMHFSNLNQPARLHINLYFILIQTIQLCPLAIIFSLKNMCFKRICSWGVNTIRLVRVISCEPVRVETESMNFSKDSMFYKLYI